MADVDRDIVEKGPRGPMIRMTRLLGKTVVDRNGRGIGKIHDIFGVRDGPKLGAEEAFRVHHFVVGPGALGDRLGYDRHDMTGPWPLSVLFNFLKREGRGFTWRDVDRVTDERVVLKATFSELSRTEDLPKPDHSGRGVGNAVYLGLRLLDSQILDSSGHMCGNVDDLELTLRGAGGLPWVTAVLAGPGALAHRIGGRIGAWIESVHTRLHPEDGGPARIDFGCVDRVWHQVELNVARDELPTYRLEKWVCDVLISKIPGANG